MSDAKEQVDAVIRVVSNKCRNLRKVIDRARALEAAEAKGQTLNEEQRESVRGVARKEALLLELQEILRKQTAIVTPPEPETAKISRRAAKAARAKAREKEAEKPKIEQEVETAKQGDDTEQQNSTGAEADRTNGVGKESTSGSEVAAESQKTSSSELESLRKELSDVKISQDQRIAQDTTEAVRKTLNLFHIVDFLRQQGSREALLSYYEPARDKQQARTVTNLDLDLLCYFNIMLTTPNGNVPHPEAVNVSTAHCLEYLKASAADAFEGTSYATLASIVETVASCPILTDRGDDVDVEKDDTDAQETKGPKVQGERVTEPNSEPGLMVDDPITDGDRA